MSHAKRAGSISATRRVWNTIRGCTCRSIRTPRIACRRSSMRSPRVTGWAGSDAKPRRQAESKLELIHSARHVQKIKELALAGGGAIDPDTYVGEPTYRAALHAAGGACEMARALMAHEASLGFCGVRPSGHHAEPDRAMGFCLFNNVAIAAEFAMRRAWAPSACSSSTGTFITATALPRRSATAPMSCSDLSTSPGSTPAQA